MAMTAGTILPTPRTGAAAATSSPRLARATLGAVICAAALAGVVGGAPSSAARVVADPDLERLLRFMALLKSAMAAGAVAAVLWRLGIAIQPLRFGAYALACAAMAAGPGLIWGLERVGSGALLLHGGLFVCLVLLWRDPGVAARFSAALRARRHSP